MRDRLELLDLAAGDKVAPLLLGREDAVAEVRVFALLGGDGGDGGTRGEDLVGAEGLGGLELPLGDGFVAAEVEREEGVVGFFGDDSTGRGGGVSW